MTTIPEPFALTPGQTADANQLEADLAAIRTICNGSLEMGVNVQAGTPSALDGSSLLAGSSLLGARADHQHIVRGVEQLTADPTGTQTPGRLYYNTTTNQFRLCIAATPTWITIGNMAASDLPTHASRHATGGADPLSNNSISEPMFAARTITTGLPSADVTLSANAWTDIITGVSPTITATQAATIYVNAGFNNSSGSNTPKVAFRVLDQNATVLHQTYPAQMGTSGGGNDQRPVSFSVPVSFAASPTLKLQADADTTGVTVWKSNTANGSTFGVTRMSVVVG